MALKTLYLDTSSINSGMLLGENGTLYGTDQKGKGNIFQFLQMVFLYPYYILLMVQMVGVRMDI